MAWERDVNFDFHTGTVRSCSLSSSKSWSVASRRTEASSSSSTETPSPSLARPGARVPRYHRDARRPLRSEPLITRDAVTSRPACSSARSASSSTYWSAQSSHPGSKDAGRRQRAARADHSAPHHGAVPSPPRRLRVAGARPDGLPHRSSASRASSYSLTCTSTSCSTASTGARTSTTRSTRSPSASHPRPCGRSRTSATRSWSSTGGTSSSTTRSRSPSSCTWPRRPAWSRGRPRPPRLLRDARLRLCYKLTASLRAGGNALETSPGSSANRRRRRGRRAGRHTHGRRHQWRAASSSSTSDGGSSRPLLI